MNVLQTLEMVREFKKSTNEALFKMWVHSVAIDQSGVWKKPEYYKGAEQMSHLANGTFAYFFKEIFGYSIRWYNRMSQIHKLKNGEELFIKHGYTNMVTYCNSTKQEREVLLVEAEKTLNTVTFNSIKIRLFPKQKNIKEADKVIDVDALVKENSLLKKKLEEAKTKYEAEIKDRENQIQALQKKYLEEVETHKQNIKAMRLTFNLMNGVDDTHYKVGRMGAA